jgi:small subunit ribosomal protein S9
MAEEKKKLARKKTAAAAKAAPRKRAVKRPAPEKVPPAAEAAPQPVSPPVVEAHRPKKVKAPKVTVAKFYATGRRKTAIARVYLFSGTGKITVNQQTADDYLCRRPVLLKTVNHPFILTNTQGRYDVEALVLGGGVPCQADALRMGIARALAVANPELRPTLRTTDMLKRDPREKERKKYGLKRARRAFQYSKR